MKYKLLSICCYLVILFSSQSYAKQHNQWLEHLDLNRYENSVVYLYFWASWCGLCRQSFPWLNKMQEKYKDRDLVVIGINLDRDVTIAEHFLTKIPAIFLLYSDPTGEFGRKYQLQGMPSSYIFDGNGQLSETYVGFKKSNIAEYESNIVKLLNQLDDTKE